MDIPACLFLKLISPHIWGHFKDSFDSPLHPASNQCHLWNFWYMCGQRVNILFLQCRDQEQLFQFPFAAFALFFFVLLYECIALLSVFEQLLYSKSLCKVFCLPPCLLSIFFTLPSEEFRFPVHAWVCRYYTYVRVSSMYIQ